MLYRTFYRRHQFINQFACKHFPPLRFGLWPFSSSFHRPQFRTARPRIAINLFFFGSHWFLDQQPVVPLLCSFSEGIFDDAVLQRVKADDYQPSSRFQHLRGGVQQRPQIVQFTVYEYSESLKSFRRGMNPSFCLIHWPGRDRYDFRELHGSAYRPRPDNGSGDSPRPPFVTEFVNHIGKLTLVEVVYHLLGGEFGLRIHSHVEPSFRLKTEATRRVL